jgi:hypothetical protein
MKTITLPINRKEITTFQIGTMLDKKLKTQIKKLIVLAILGFAAFVTFAQRQPMALSALNIRLSDGAPFKLFIDGQQAGGIGNESRTENLMSGQHYIQVYRVANNRGYERMWNAFTGYVNLTGNAESFVTIYPEMQKLKFDNVIAFNYSNCQEPNQPVICYYPRRPERNAHPTNVVNTSSHCEETPMPTQHACGPVAMSQNDFVQLKRTINNGSFESTRLSIFKQALAYNYFTSYQVRDLMDLFWFESSKLEMAKLAYPKTIDQNNYYIVNNGFNFSSSVNELGEYVAMR